MIMIILIIVIQNNDLNLAVSPTTGVCQFCLNALYILLTPTNYFDRQSAFSLLKPSFVLSASTCLYHALFNLFPLLIFNLNVGCLSYDMTIMHAQWMIMKMNTFCHRQLIYQQQRQILTLIIPRSALHTGLTMEHCLSKYFHLIFSQTPHFTPIYIYWLHMVFVNSTFQS